MPQTEVEVKK